MKWVHRRKEGKKSMLDTLSHEHNGPKIKKQQIKNIEDKKKNMDK